MARTWIRLYTELPNVAKIQRLPHHLIVFLLNCWCLTGASDDELLPLPDEIAWRLHIDAEICSAYLTHLHSIGLLDQVGDRYQPHNWNQRQFISDDSKERVRKLRKNKAVAVSNAAKPLHVTPPDSDTDSYSEQIHTQTRTENPAARNAAEVEALVDKLHDRHPSNGCGRAEIRKKVNAILKRYPGSETLATIDRNHIANCETPGWKRGYAKGLANWLAPTEDRWKDPPPPPRPEDDLPDFMRGLHD